MSTFQERLTLEKQELDEKLSKLNAFITGDNVLTIDPYQQSLLKIQVYAMTAYSQVLAERIVWLK